MLTRQTMRAEQAYIEFFRALARSAPDHAIEEDAELVLIASGSTLPMLNYAAVQRLPADPSRVISRVRAFYHGRVSRVMLAAPPDAAAVLLPEAAAAGAGQGEPRLLLLREPGQERPGRPAPAGLEIHSVDGRPDFQDYVTTMTAGFGGSDWADLAHVDIDRLLAVPGAEHYLGLLAGEPVATAMRFSSQGVTVVANVSVRPEHRRRGIGEAITRRTLDDGVSAGCPLGFLQASEDGEPVYRRMGFHDARPWHAWLLDS